MASVIALERHFCTFLRLIVSPRSDRKPGRSRGATRSLISAEPWSKPSRSTIEAGEALANFCGGDGGARVELVRSIPFADADATTVEGWNGQFQRSVGEGDTPILKPRKCQSQKYQRILGGLMRPMVSLLEAFPVLSAH